MDHGVAPACDDEHSTVARAEAGFTSALLHSTEQALKTGRKGGDSSASTKIAGDSDGNSSTSSKKRERAVRQVAKTGSGKSQPSSEKRIQSKKTVLRRPRMDIAACCQSAAFAEIQRLYKTQDASVLEEIACGKRGFRWLVNACAPKFNADGAEPIAVDALLRFIHLAELPEEHSVAEYCLRWAELWEARSFALALVDAFPLRKVLTVEIQQNHSQRINFSGRYNHLKKIGDQYDVDGRIIGRGLSGPVRLAVHKETGKNYALKTLRLDNVSALQRKAILNEVAIYSSLDHPNIVKLLEIYEGEAPSECVHLVMEYASGRELYDRLMDKKKYSERDAARITKEMLLAIKYLHSRNIAHRDIKLENWLFESPNKDAKLRLIDFGFSKLYDGTPFSAISGTVYYVSPEVIKGSYDLRCDMWSLGIIVYMLLSGRPPFYASSDAAVLRLIEVGRFSLSGPLWEPVSDDAKHFIQSMLKVDPSERLTAADALLHPWISHPEQILVESVPIDPLVLASLRSYAQASTLKRAAWSLIAFSLTMNEIHDLEQQFKSLDKDHSGEIRFSDFCATLETHLHLPKAEAKAVFHRLRNSESREGLDSDDEGDPRSNTIQFTEFLAGALQARLQMDEERIRQVFRRLDEDDSGYIDLCNLKSVLGEEYNGTKVEDMLKEFGVEGVIDYEHFKKCL
eukprot:GEMP01012496.1.p1 GENE.GEMP01012496.1~~GEMP01012496.1.p1  ORF type:complete len:683 (+),score=143.73 GEMP01012496.1:258-2306(+)